MLHAADIDEHQHAVTRDLDLQHTRVRSSPSQRGKYANQEIYPQVIDALLVRLDSISEFIKVKDTLDTTVLPLSICQSLRYAAEVSVAKQLSSRWGENSQHKQ